MAEAFKSTITRSAELGDPAFSKIPQLIKNVSKKSFPRANLSEAHIWIPNHYDSEYAILEDHGTTHISVVDANEIAISRLPHLIISGVLKLWIQIFGSLFNDQMDDFTIPILPTIERFWPTPHNFPAPGKKPMLSTCSTIIKRPDGRFEMASSVRLTIIKFW
ncbi:22172_t:CDS:2 [Dentiscutata erythropus]|uniref:22172_t:CDS:1 n=1 Tax=Dentiscutata erythropus TaxID=1348616 RepID=A0A9N9N7M7_9GLOM|nr:22172_t:CDS:2 [Dentiscutata erythropus]